MIEALLATAALIGLALLGTVIILLLVKWVSK